MSEISHEELSDIEIDPLDKSLQLVISTNNELCKTIKYLETLNNELCKLVSNINNVNFAVKNQLVHLQKILD